LRVAAKALTQAVGCVVLGSDSMMFMAMRRKM
jgi:hypothetical protein